MKPYRLILVMLVASVGCQPSTQEEFRKIGGTWGDANVTHVRVKMQSMGEATNNGLLLPVISPDGKRIAWMEYHGDAAPAMESLRTGKNSSGMSLHLRELAEGSPSRVVCASGAIWPTWSWDGTRLLYVLYARDGGCSLCVYDTNNGKTRRLSTGCDGIRMPAVSPTGEAIAFVAQGQSPEQLRLYVLSSAEQKLTPCPIQFPGEQHTYPSWTADGRIVFLRQSPGRSSVVHWKPGVFPPESLVPIPIADKPMARFQSFAGIGRSLSPDDQRFAYYDALRDRIVLLSLRGDHLRTELKAGTRAGCWFDPKRFVAATDDELRLFTDAEQSALLVRGNWLPRECVRNSNQLILCTRGAHRREFRIIRMLVDAVP